MKRILSTVWLICLLQSALAAQLDPIRYEMGGDPVSLDPALATDIRGYRVLANITEGLFSIDEHGRLRNGLARTHVKSKDGKRYSFTISKSARWSDGKHVTPDEFAFALKRALDPAIAAPYASLLYSIRGAKAYNSGKGKPEDVGIRVHRGELILDLETRDNTLLWALSMPFAAPIRRDLLEKNSRKWNIDFPVTGDYQISSYKLNREIILEPNPLRKRPGQRNIVFQIIHDSKTALNLFESGHLDIAFPGSDDVVRFKKNADLHTTPSALVCFLGFNTKTAPFDRVEWRRAVAGVIDKAAVSKLYEGIYSPAGSYVPPGIEGFAEHQDERPQYRDAVSKIRSLNQKPKITFQYAGSASNAVLSEKLQNDLKLQLGIDISLEPLEWGVFSRNLMNNPAQMYFLCNSAMFNSPFYYWKTLTASDPENYGRYDNPDFNRLVAEAKEADQSRLRTTLLQRLEEVAIKQDAALIPLFYSNAHTLVSRKISGWNLNPFRVTRLKSLRKSD